MKAFPFGWARRDARAAAVGTRYIYGVRYSG